VAVLAVLQLVVVVAVVDYWLVRLAQFRPAHRLQLMWAPAEPVPVTLFQAVLPITDSLVILLAQRFQL
jgi:hypothetical protein